MKAFATEEEETTKYFKGNDKAYDLGVKKALLFGGINFMGQFFVFGSLAVIIVLGAKLYEDEKISLGDITSYLLQMLQLLMNFMGVASVFSSIMTVSFNFHSIGHRSFLRSC